MTGRGRAHSAPHSHWPWRQDSAFNWPIRVESVADWRDSGGSVADSLMSSPPDGKPGDPLLLAMWAEWHDGTVSMATNDELSLEWSMLSEDYYTWDDSGEYKAPA